MIAIKTIRKCTVVLAGFGLLTMSACHTANNPQIVDISISERNETWVKLTWDISGDASQCSRIDFIITNESDPVEGTRTFSLEGHSARSILIEGLTGLTIYNYQMQLLNANSEMIFELPAPRTFTTSYSSRLMTFSTRDGYLLKGEFFYLSTWEKQVPGIIMMHGLTETMQPWSRSPIMDLFIENGYACMAFFFRGHGNSQGFDTDLFKTDSACYYAGCDVEAAIKSIEVQPEVDPEKIGTFGGSMGASASVIGNYYPQVQTSVALSVIFPDYIIPFPEFFSEFGLDPVALQSVYYIVGENDSGGGGYAGSVGYDMPEQSRRLFNNTLEPKKIWIIPDAKHHGSALATYEGVNDSVVIWFSEQMPSPFNQ